MLEFCKHFLCRMLVWFIKYEKIYEPYPCRSTCSLLVWTILYLFSKNFRDVIFSNWGLINRLDICYCNKLLPKLPFLGQQFPGAIMQLKYFSEKYNSWLELTMIIFWSNSLLGIAWLTRIVGSHIVSRYQKLIGVSFIKQITRPTKMGITTRSMAKKVRLTSTWSLQVKEIQVWWNTNLRLSSKIKKIDEYRKDILWSDIWPTNHQVQEKAF